MNADIAVIVVNYGSSALLEQNLRRLSGRFTIVVVDNFTDLPERHAVSALALHEGWETVLLDTNTGFGHGMNRGAALAQELGAQALLLLNPDAVIEPSAVDALHRLVAESPDTMVAPRILRPDGSMWSTGSDLYLEDGRIRSRRRRPETEVRVEEWLSGAVLMLSADLWRRSGGFDDEYFLYWEDVDLSHRVTSAGGRLSVASDITTVHAEGGTQQAGRAEAGQAKSRTYYYFNIRNRLLYGARHLETSDLAAWRRQSLPIAWEVLMQGGRKQLLRSPGVLVTAWRAVRAGHRIADTELDRRRRLPYSRTEEAHPKRHFRRPLP